MSKDKVKVTTKSDGMVGSIIGNLTGAPSHKSTATSSSGKSADGYGTSSKQSESNARSNLSKK